MTNPTPKQVAQWAREASDSADHIAQQAFAAGAASMQRAAPQPVNQMPLDAVALAYGHLWHINNEPMAPIPLRSDGDASYAARKILRDLLTTEQRGNGINQARAAIAAAEQQGAGK